MDDHVKNTIKDIRELRIQGAQTIAKAAVTAIASYVLQNKHIDDHRFFGTLAEIESARPTEPALRNALRLFIMKDGRTAPTKAAKYVQGYFEHSQKKIQGYVQEVLQEDKQYFTHCHSSTVTRSFTAAWADGIRFSVANTETRPLFQGRKTAVELAQAGIPVVHGVDSAGRVLLKDCAACFFGCDAVLRDGTVINKIGSELFAEAAHSRRIPVYVVTHGLKLSDHSVRGHQEIIEERKPGEVWDKPPRGVHIANYAFERIAPKNITAIISELGVLKPAEFVRVARKTYPFIVDKEVDARKKKK